MNDLSTREKILKTSHKLFSDKGLNGVSVREIARSCGVNIAAVNYHFQNKENLYLETIKCSIVEAAEDMRNLYEALEKKNINDFVLAVFKHYMGKSEDLRTAFKLIISSDRFYDSMGEDMANFSGPPGGEYYALCLKNEIPTAKDEDIDWAVRVLFTHVIHKALMLCNKSICESLAKNGVGQDVLEKDILRLTNIVKKELIENKFSS